MGIHTCSAIASRGKRDGRGAVKTGAVTSDPHRKEGISGAQREREGGGGARTVSAPVKAGKNGRGDRRGLFPRPV